MRILFVLFFSFLFLGNVFSATRTISDAGGDWGNTGTWVEGIVPDSSDDIVAQGDGTSGNLTISDTQYAGTVNFTNYTGTFTINSGCFLYLYGNITLASGMTINNQGVLIIMANSSITCNGKNIGVLYIYNGTDVGLLDDFYGNIYFFSVSSGGSLTTNNHNITGDFLWTNSDFAVDINLGTSTLTLLSFIYMGIAGSSIDADEATIVISGSPKYDNAFGALVTPVFSSNGGVYGTVKINTSSACEILGDFTVNNLKFTDGTPADRLIFIEEGKTINVNTSFTAMGDSTHSIILGDNINGTWGLNQLYTYYWLSTTTYATDEVVYYGNKMWESLSEDNLNNTPSEGSWWTEFVPYNPSTTYNTEDPAFYLGRFWFSLQDDNTGNTPNSDGSWWTDNGSAWTISKDSGTVETGYLKINHSTATGGATWNACGSTDVGDNTGWNFTTCGGGGEGVTPVSSQLIMVD